MGPPRGPSCRHPSLERPKRAQPEQRAAPRSPHSKRAPLEHQVQGHPPSRSLRSGAGPSEPSRSPAPKAEQRHTPLGRRRRKLQGRRGAGRGSMQPLSQPLKRHLSPGQLQQVLGGRSHVISPTAPK
ncbi:hypothetical protein NDU88_002995 [Pleurodeles waltl]|uniref:Uncharacterized protein n=1 Tax=Pleurodeles waltl TaxID=8319 RepID=A0AAV7NGV8_PLEWA|nr:hypothetical protein NDU88_002995 [Pleurodeles waltl]